MLMFALYLLPRNFNCERHTASSMPCHVCEIPGTAKGLKWYR